MLPYKGSKRRMATWIADTIEARHPVGTIVDLFAGGYAITEEFSRRGWSVIANDLNPYTTALYRKLGQDPMLSYRLRQAFISKSCFKSILAAKDSFPDWYVGYLLTVWTFGNNQRSYLYSPEYEILKHAAFQLISHAEPRYLQNLFGLNPVIDELAAIKTYDERYKAKAKLGVLDKTLAYIEPLQRIARLKKLSTNTQLLVGDYKDVEIPAGAIIYADPPYEVSKNNDYYMSKLNTFDFDRFWMYMNWLSIEHPVYVSSYVAPDEWQEVGVFKTITRYASTSNRTPVTEKLFTSLACFL